MQGSVRALKAAPKLHNYDSTRNSDTQKYNFHIFRSVKLQHILLNYGSQWLD